MNIPREAWPEGAVAHHQKHDCAYWIFSDAVRQGSAQMFGEDVGLFDDRITPRPDFALLDEAERLRAENERLREQLSSAINPEPIETDETLSRHYIPIPGGWEVQTKGSGSTFRIVDPYGRRIAIPDAPCLHETIERMARDIHAAVSSEAKP